MLGTFKRLEQTTRDLRRIGAGGKHRGEAREVEEPGKRESRSTVDVPLANAKVTNADLLGQTLEGSRDTNRAGDALVMGEARTFPVGGIKLGMSLREVVRVVSASGGRFDHFGPALSFRSEVEQRAAMRSRRTPPLEVRAIATASASLGNGARLFVHLQQEPTGPVVSIVDLALPWSGHTPETIKARFKVRYGAPCTTSGTQDRFFRMRWVVARNCRAADQAAFLTVEGKEDGIHFWLAEGLETSSEREQLLERHVVAAASSGRGGAF